MEAADLKHSRRTRSMIMIDRHAQWRLFFRVGAFAVGVALSAALLVRVVSNYRFYGRTVELLEREKANGLKREQSIQKSRAIHQQRTERRLETASNERFISDFYSQVSEATDLPLLKTSFIVGHKLPATATTNGILVTVPRGVHWLTLRSTMLPDSLRQSEQPKQTQEDKEQTESNGSNPNQIRVPLISEASYRILFVQAEDDRSAFVEITSNDRSFQTIRCPFDGRFKDLVMPAQQGPLLLHPVGSKNLKDQTESTLCTFKIQNAKSADESVFVLSIDTEARE